MKNILGIVLLSISLNVSAAVLDKENPMANFDALSNIDKGMAIAIETDRRDKGWLNTSAEMVMTLIDARDRETTRNFRSFILEVEADGDKSMNVFDSPRDVKGTVNLTFSHGLEPDDQWLYLPALNRVKRISSRNKSGPFMGSEFAFEDLSSWEIEKYSYEYIREEELEGRQCYVVKNIPAYKYSGYTKRIEWVDTEIYQPRKIVYYDRKGSILKTMYASDYRLHKDKYWRNHKLLMENHQTGKKTLLVWKSLKFGDGLGQSEFTPGKMSKIR